MPRAYSTDGGRRGLTPRVIARRALGTAWPLVEPLLSAGLDAGGGELDADDLRAMIEAHRAFLIVCVDRDEQIRAALVIEFQDFPKYRVGHVVTIGGRGVLASRDGWRQIKRWLKANGCRYVQCWAKGSRERLWQLMGFTTCYQVMRGEL